jgi:DNA-binding GntR family transcriptional regulator
MLAASQDRSALADRAEGLVVFRWFGADAPQTLSLPEQIAARLGDRILDGDYAPGDRLIEQDLAAAYKVSRGPIRDALRLLAREGLVRIHARRGAEVTRLSIEEVAEIFEIRLGLFAIATRKVAEQRDPAFLARYRDAVDELARHAETDDEGARYTEIVFQTSLMTARGAGNLRLAEMLTALSLQTLRYTRLALASVDSRRRSLELWREALVCLERGDVAGFEAAGLARIRGSMRNAMAALEPPAAT